MSSRFDPYKHHRRSIRLKGYDYSQPGTYFVTIVTYQHECLFGDIVDGEMRLNKYGKIVKKWWKEIPNHFPNVEVIAFAIMPNHVHGIILINDDRRGAVSAPDNQDIERRGMVSMPENEITSQPDEKTPIRGEMTSPYICQPWDRLWHISNINLRRK